MQIYWRDKTISGFVWQVEYFPDLKFIDARTPMAAVHFLFSSSMLYAFLTCPLLCIFTPDPDL